MPGGMWTRFLEETYFATSRSDTAVLYPNYFLPPTASKRSSTYCIIHDCQHRVFPQFFSPKKRLWLDANFRRTLSKADRVFLISEFERSQIARFYGDALADRCRVIYNAIDWARFDRERPSTKALALARKPYILSVSDQAPHKKTNQIIDAFCHISTKIPDLRLVLVGHTGDSVLTTVRQIASQSVRERISFSGFISDADLGHLYANCSLFASASTYEGFGMTAVEAMGFGAPVLVKDCTATPEVTLGLANYLRTGASTVDWSEEFDRLITLNRNQAKSEEIAFAIRTRYAPATVAQTLLSGMEA
jgi:glycosyltransferase involved in cell wall biosynthesis